MSFPKYQFHKDSGDNWLGPVPFNWGILPLKAVASCNDEVLPETTDGESIIEYVEISGVEEGRGITQTESMTFDSSPSRARRIVRHGDVLLSTVRTYLRAIAPVVHPPENLVASTGFAAIRPRSIDARFLSYVLHCEYLVAEVIARSVGISYPAINASELMCLKAPIPDRNEQTQIASFLDHETAKIDALVAEQQRLIELLQEKRQAVISHAVTKGLDPSVPLKDSGVEWIDSIPSHWCVLPIFRLGYERAIPNTGMIEDNLLSLSYGRIVQKNINSSDGLLPESFETYQIVQPGDIVLRLTDLQNDKRSLRSAIVTQRGIITSAYSAITFDQINPEFVSYLLRAYDVTKVFYSMGGGLRQSLKFSDIKHLPIFIPSADEQEEIVSYLNTRIEKMDALTDEAKEAVALLQERRTALISAAVTGKIDVRNWQAKAQKEEVPA